MGGDSKLLASFFLLVPLIFKFILLNLLWVTILVTCIVKTLDIFENLSNIKNTYEGKTILKCLTLGRRFHLHPSFFFLGVGLALKYMEKTKIERNDEGQTVVEYIF